MKNTRTTKVTPVPSSTGSIAITATDPERMKAIVSLARAVERLSAALAEPTQVTVTGCTLTATGATSSAPMIVINPE